MRLAMSKRSRYALVVAAIGLVIGAWSQTHQASDIGSLTQTCLDSLDTVFGYYTNAVYAKDDCDPDCLKQCAATLQRAINAISTKNCPLQKDITYCFGLYPDMWVNYVQTCGLFAFSNSDAEAAALAAEASQQSNPDYNASRSVVYQTVLTSTSGTSGRRRLSSLTEGDLEELPRAAGADALADATPEARRRLLDLGSVGETGESNGVGCFPAFVDSADFRLYITRPDYWFEVNWSHYSQTGGIIVSVIFWVVFALVLFNVKGFKFWKKKETLSEKVQKARATAAERRAKLREEIEARKAEGNDDFVSTKLQPIAAPASFDANAAGYGRAGEHSVVVPASGASLSPAKISDSGSSGAHDDDLDATARGQDSFDDFAATK